MQCGKWKKSQQNRDCLPEIATGAKRPRNDKSGAISILTIVCSGRERTDGSGMPLPYKIEKSRQETRRDADCQKNCPAENFGGKKSVKGNRQGVLSRQITRRSGRIAKSCCKI